MALTTTNWSRTELLDIEHSAMRTPRPCSMRKASGSARSARSQGTGLRLRAGRAAQDRAHAGQCHRARHVSARPRLGLRPGLACRAASDAAPAFAGSRRPAAQQAGGRRLRSRPEARCHVPVRGRRRDSRRTTRRCFRLGATVMARGDGGFGGPSGSGPRPHRVPRRDPDLSCDIDTRIDQALLFRLNGDRNPLHADPQTCSAARGSTRRSCTALHLRHRLPRRPLHDLRL